MSTYQVQSELDADHYFLFFFLLFLFFFEFLESADIEDCLEMTGFDVSDSKVCKFVVVTVSFPKQSTRLNLIESFISSSCSIRLSSFAIASCLNNYLSSLSVCSTASILSVCSTTSISSVCSTQSIVGFQTSSFYDSPIVSASVGS